MKKVILGFWILLAATTCRADSVFEGQEHLVKFARLNYMNEMHLRAKVIKEVDSLIDSGQFKKAGSKAMVELGYGRLEANKDKGIDMLMRERFLRLEAKMNVAASKVYAQAIDPMASKDNMKLKLHAVKEACMHCHIESSWK